MKNLIYILLLLAAFKTTRAQLLPSIGITSQPASSATICDAPWYLGSFYTSGYQVGNSVPDFKLYDLNGDSIILSDELTAGKPVVLISGNLTCPVFRNKVPVINQIISTYGSAIKVFVIYTLEAHPTDTSVYFGNINVTSQNQSAGILFPQPTTYGARKQMVDTMSYYLTLNAPVFIDGPCNEWWSAFGPAPNNAYIISPSGTVLKKHGWFDKSPDKIFCDIDNVLSITSGSCITTTAPGTFTINVLNSFINGNPTELLLDNANIINTESVSVTVSVKKIQKNHPAGWQTAFCADVCYSTAEDSIGFTIAPFDTMAFSLDFYTDAIPDSGSVKVGFKNPNKPNNSFTYRFRASTLPFDVGISETQNEMKSISLFPNPSNEKTTISTDEKKFTVNILDLNGKIIYEAINDPVIDLVNIPNGIYLVSLQAGNTKSKSKLVVLK
ncbi:MAG: hypothetical protein K0S32_890 [Bacteroidetes bacterium]|nr:hypothetical protein [Bacteroidota bacterium]